MSRVLRFKALVIQVAIPFVLAGATLTLLCGLRHTAGPNSTTPGGPQDHRMLREPGEDTTPPPQSLPFETVACGLISGFGGYCEGLPPDQPAVDPKGIEDYAAPPGWPCFADFARPRFEAIIRDQCAWQDLWQQHGSVIVPAPPIPEVDFDQYVVVAVIAGPRPNGCYSIGIADVYETSWGRLIEVHERVPCPEEQCWQVITNPYHFVKVDRRYLPYNVPIGFAHGLP